MDRDCLPWKTFSSLLLILTLALPKVGLLSKLQENMTVFVPTNEAVEEFHRNLMEFNTLELESPEKNEVAEGFMCQNIVHLQR